MLLLVILLVIVIALLITIVVMQRRSIRNQEAAMQRLVPAYVDSTLALTTSIRSTEFILALVPQPTPEQRAASTAELDQHVTQALDVVHETPRFAPVYPLRHRSTN